MYDNRDMELTRGETKIACEAAPRPLAVIVDSANCKANEIMMMVQKIDSHIFGFNNSETVNPPSPSCLAEALTIHDRTISDIYEKLKILTERLGV